MENAIIILVSYLLSSSMFIFWVSKGGFNRKYLYTDNLTLGTISAILGLLLYHQIDIHIGIFSLIILPFIVFFLFVGLFLYRFFRNPKRVILGDKNDIVAPADGRIIYIKELEVNQTPVSIKKMRVANISEITKTDILSQPCYLIGIAMTLFDVHYNRAPIDGDIILVKHTKGTAIGLNTPESTLTNERNTVVFKRQDGIMAGIVQIAARGVTRCIVMAKEGSNVKRGEIIGKIRWGSQTDLIIPRDSIILVREGEQIHAGSTIVAKLNK
ncbi:MAG: phosphatidylserine decarboxylase [Bacteroidota bacterium]